MFIRLSPQKGAIYASEVNELFLHGRVIPRDIYDPNLDTHFVFDLGFTDATVRIAYQLPPLGGKVHIVNVQATHGKDIFHYIDDLHSFGGPVGNVWLPHDARAKNLQTGKSIVEQFLAFDIIAPDDPEPPRPRRHLRSAEDSVPPLIRRERPHRRTRRPGRIRGRVPADDFIEALKGYHREWDEDHLMFKDIPVHDWTSDYADCTALPRRRHPP